MSEKLISRTVIQENQEEIVEKNIWERFTKFSLEIKRSTRKSRKTKDKNLVIQRTSSSSKMSNRSTSSNKKTRKIEILESIKQKSRDETIEIYSSTNKIFSSKLKLKIMKSTKISTSVKTSFVSSIVKKISKTIFQNQSIVTSRTLQIFLIESISFITSKKKINK
jgi:hypothetical protein